MLIILICNGAEQCIRLKGTNGVSTVGVTANVMFFDRGTFGILPLTYVCLPESARVYLFPNLSKSLFVFVAAPLVFTPFVRRNQAQSNAYGAFVYLALLRRTARLSVPSCTLLMCGLCVRIVHAK